MKISLSLVVALSLVGCAGFGTLDKGLDALVGRDLSYAVAKMGYPSGERTVAGMRFVDWGRSTSAVMPVMNTSTTNGVVTAGVKTANYQASTNTTSFVPVNYNCQITLKVSDKNVIEGSQYNGNLGGCMPYIQALKVD